MSSPLLWGPSSSLNLQSGIQLTNTGSTVLTGTVNPSVTATNGLPGSLYLNNSNGAIYTKQDAGTTTNWITSLSSVTPLAAYSITTTQPVAANAVIPFDTVISDPGGLFTSSTTFTCPVPGVYICSITVVTAATSNIYLVKTGTTFAYIATGSSAAVNSGTVAVACVKGDTLQFFSQSSVAYNGASPGASCTMVIMLQPQQGGGGTSIQRTTTSVSTATTAVGAIGTDYIYLVSGTTTLTLPTAVGNNNLYTVKNTGVATVTVATTSAQTIDGSATASLPVANTSLSLISDNANWRIV